MALAYEGALGTVEIAATTSSIAGWENQVHFHSHFYTFPKNLFTCKGDLPSLVGKYISRQQGRSWNWNPMMSNETAVSMVSRTSVICHKHGVWRICKKGKNPLCHTAQTGQTGLIKSSPYPLKKMNYPKSYKMGKWNMFHFSSFFFAPFSYRTNPNFWLW